MNWLESYQKLKENDYIFDEDTSEIDRFHLEFQQIGVFLEDEKQTLENEKNLNSYIQK